MNRIVVTVSILLLASVSLSVHAQGTLDFARSKGMVILGYQPHAEPLSQSSNSHGGEPRGFSIDLCKEAVAELSEELGLKNIAIKWVEATPAKGIELVQAGKMHIFCGSVTNTIERQKKVDFSYITFVTGSKLLIRKDSPYRSVWDLSGKRIALFRDTTAEKVFDMKLVGSGGLKAEKLVVESRDEGIREVKNGDVEALLSDDILLKGILHNPEANKDFMIVGKHLSYEPYALVLPRGDIDFRDIVNRRLAELFRSERIWTIYKTHFEDYGPPSDLLYGVYLAQSLPSYGD